MTTYKPPRNEKWYRRKSYGGWSPCIAGVPNYEFDASGKKKLTGNSSSVLSNCVGATFGDVQTFLNRPKDNPLLIGCVTDHPVSAKDWYTTKKKDGCKRGSLVVPNSVACWRKKDGSIGHVAFIREVDRKAGKVTTTESSYKSDAGAYRTKTYNLSMDKGSAWEFQGCIYLPGYEPEEQEFNPGDKVRILGKGNATSAGTGRTAGGIGWKRIIKRVIPGASYPYQVGTEKATTGFYRADALEKL